MAPKNTISSAVCANKAASVSALAISFSQAIPTAAREQLDDSPSADPLKQLADAPQVLKAQATKIGLLLVNKPLTPSAIHDILQDLETPVLPALFSSAVQVIGRKNVYGNELVGETSNLLKDVLGTVGPLMDKARAVLLGQNVTKDDVLVAVGKLYAACDELVALANGGVPVLLLRKVKEQVALMEDAIEELKTWGEEMENSGDGVSDDEADLESEREREDSLGTLTRGLTLQDNDKESSLFTYDAKALLNQALHGAGLVSKLCQALAKRRIKRFKSKSLPFEDNETEQRHINDMVKLDRVVSSINLAQEEVDEIAGAFYEFDLDMVRSRLHALTEHGKTVVELLWKSWSGEEDDFTKWLNTWKVLIDKNASWIQKNH